MNTEQFADFHVLPYYISSADYPIPVLESDVHLNGEFGYFPHFAPWFKHGFHWKNSKNVNYSAENQEQRVTGALENMLTHLDMQPLANAFFANAVSGLRTIVDITDQMIEDLPSTPRARHVMAGAYFTTVKDLPVYAKAGDCTWTFVQAETEDGRNVGGLIHAGRIEASHFFPTRAIEHLLKEYHARPESIKLGIIPSLEPRHHTIQNVDYTTSVKYPQRWASHSVYIPDSDTHYFDLRSFVAAQYMRKGVHPNNIHVSLAGTYEGAEKGYGFSYRQSRFFPSNRFGLAFQLG